MSRTILADVDGFTPIIDAVIEEVGLMSAVVFGRMWRFCQMGDGVCKASLEKIAEGIDVDRATVQRHAEKLCEAGFLKDLTPDLRNRPHIYVDTGKAGLRLSFSGVAQSNVEPVTVAESNVTIAQGNVTVAESHMNKDFKRLSKIQEEEEERATAEIVKAYETEIGVITPMIADGLKDAAGTYPLKWTLDAIREAAAQNKRNWKYVEAILKRWKAQGNQEPIKPQGAVNGNYRASAPKRANPPAAPDPADDPAGAAARINARNREKAGLPAVQ